MSYKDFVNYCIKLDGISDWTSKEGKGIADLPGHSGRDAAYLLMYVYE